MSWTETSVTVPPSCQVKHRGFVLANGCRVIIATDPAAAKSTAAMSLNVGSHFDPVALPGLAHLCEHMLFLGTEKHPGEGEYSNFIATNGGDQNAWTEDASTNYYFNVANDAFLPALEMFLPFFVCPLMTASSLEREVKAVHSEDEKNHSSDHWCLDEILKLRAANPRHPQSRYGNGNLQTLWNEPKKAGVDVRAELLRFFETHYVAENAALGVYTNQRAEDVLAVVDRILASMRRGARTVDRHCVPPYDVATLGAGRWFNLQTNRATQHLRVYFPLPFAAVPSCPSGYASHYIGHECDGSLLSVLKAEGLAEGLSAGCAGEGVDLDHDLFSISVKLTADGVRRVDEVAAMVFQGLRKMRDDGLREDLFDDDLKTHQLRFDFAQLDDTTEHAAHLARGANLFGIEDAWRGGSVILKPAPQLSSDVLNYFRPDNCFFVLSLQDFAAAQASDKGASILPVKALPPCGVALDQASLHHKAKYAEATVPPEVLRRWCDSTTALHPGLYTPKLNPFLVSESRLLPPCDAKYPNTIAFPRGTVWHKPDDRFLIAKTAVAILLESPVAYASPLHRFFNRVTAKLMSFSLTEDLYFAEMGGLHAAIVPDLSGVQVDIEGPSEKFAVLEERILREVFSVANKVTEATFRIYSDAVLRELLSVRVSQPSSLASECIQLWTHVHRWDYEDILRAVHPPDGAAAAPTLDQYRQYLAEFKRRLRYDAMYVGNIDDDNARRAADRIEQLLQENGAEPCTRADLPPDHVVLQLPRRRDLAGADGAARTTALANGGTPLPPYGVVVPARCPNKKDPNSAVRVTFQAGVKLPAARCHCDLLMAIVSSPFFDTLRTSETLGYIVGAGARPIDDVMCLQFTVQSAEYDALYLLSRVVAFIAAMPKLIENTTDEQWRGIIAAQIAERKDKPKSTRAEGQEWWERRRHPAGFDHKEKEIAWLERHATKQDLIHFCRTFVTHESPDARCIVALFFGDDKSHADFELACGRSGRADNGAAVAVDLPQMRRCVAKHNDDAADEEADEDGEDGDDDSGESGDAEDPDKRSSTALELPAFSDAEGRALSVVVLRDLAAFRKQHATYPLSTV